MPSVTVQGTWGDVFLAGQGLIGCAYDSGNDVIIDYYELDENKQLIHHESVRHEFGERILFVRADKNPLGQILIMGQGQITGRFKLLMFNGGPTENPNIDTYGTHPCDLYPTDDGFRYVVQVSKTMYYDSDSNDLILIPEEIHGTSNGIIQLFPSSPIWADLVREDIPGMYYPYMDGEIFIGEGRQDPPHIHALEDGEEKNIFNGIAQRPRSVYDEESNTFTVASRAPNGVTFNFFTLPLTNLDESISPMSCTPVVPPQNIVRDSLENIRNFCQTYEFQGVKPYINDEIHENGLFLADGITYFMMSDTGLWAQVLMNPDDKTPWDEKRVKADNALFKYMRERVGDFQ